MSVNLNKDYIFISLKNVDWESKLPVNLNNANTSTEFLLDSVNEVLKGILRPKLCIDINTNIGRK